LLCVRIINIFEYFKINFPIKGEQILRLNENKSFSYSKAETLIGYKPVDFNNAINNEIKIYKNVDKKNI